MDANDALIDDQRTRELRSLIKEELGGIRTVLIALVALAASAGLVLGAVAVAYITGTLTVLAGDVMGPFNANQLTARYPEVNCTDDETAFGFKANTKGLVANVTCRIPNATGSGGCCNVSTLGGGASGPSDNNTLNILGTPNRVTVSKASTNVVTLSGPQDLGMGSGPTFSAVFSTGSGFWFPNPGIGGGLEALDTYKGALGGDMPANVTVGGSPDPALIRVGAAIIGNAVVGCVRFTHNTASPGSNAILFSLLVVPMRPAVDIILPLLITTGTTLQNGYMTLTTAGQGRITTISGNFTGTGVSVDNACFAYYRAIV
jgi:hypothetical protein